MRSNCRRQSCRCTLVRAIASAGSLDGSVRVWDVASHQCIRTLRKPCEARVTNVIVLPRPHCLHVSGASRSGVAGAGAAEGQARETRKQLRPKRLAPLAPFCKFTGPSDVLRPWEDGVAIIHGAHDVIMRGAHASGVPTCIAESSGLAAACRAMRGMAPAGNEGGSGGGPVGGAASGTVHVPGGQGGVREVEAEAEALRAEGAAWKRQYAELYEASFETLTQLSQAAK